MPTPTFRAALVAALSLLASSAGVAAVVAPQAGSPAAPQTASPAVAPAVAQIPAPPDVAGPPADAQKLPSGLVTKVIQTGTGARKPGPADLVTVNYTGWTADGKMFDSTQSRGRPSALMLDRVIKGWTEGVQLMVAGETRRMWVPEALAFNGADGRPKGTLVFDIELLEVDDNPLVAPKDVAAPPADAKRTVSGLSFKVLRPGTGAEHPTKYSKVTVHYTGWTTDGKMFDSSWKRGQPASFPLDQVIKGWTEGVQLMVPGEKTRFWIPENLAYKGQAGAPAGMLVFDITLQSIGK
jgi:peptidylprolyl isomerase